MNVAPHGDSRGRDYPLRAPLRPALSATRVLPAKPVPILLTVRELHFGGIQKDVTKIALQIDRSRFAPHVAAYETDGARVEELRRAGVPVLHLPMSSLKSPSAWSAAVKMRRYVREHGIRLVHAYDTSAVFVVPLARALRVPAVLSSTLGSRELLDRRSHQQMQWTDRLVDTAVVNCEAMRRHLIEDEDFPRERIEICYNGVDPAEFHPAKAPKPDPIANAEVVIGTVGVLRPEKAVHVLQEAFARIRPLRPGLKLLIVGSGPELSKLQANGRSLGIESDCVFVPATPRVAEYLRAIDIFVSSSSSEAFSNAILEAMACGVCAVGSEVGGTPELLGNDERGLLFQPGNAADLGVKLAALIQNESLRSELGVRAAEFARTTLNMDIAARRMADIYESMLRRKAAWPA